MQNKRNFVWVLCYVIILGVDLILTPLEKLVLPDSVKQGDFDKGHAFLEAIKIDLRKEIIQKYDDKNLAS